MKIELKEISVRDLTDNYQDNAENGVTAYHGELDVRPPYQREFVYGEKERNAVIHTVKQGFPLNVMYWATRDNGTYEIIDGQQRTISICQYVKSDFAYEMRYFHNLTKDEQDEILDYKLMVYVCTGSDSEKLKWFETINIAGKPLFKQELRNAVYSGSWVSDAKKYFSKTGCPAYAIGSDYLTGSPIRQDFLETALSWISKADLVRYNGNIESYMAVHQNDPNALALWQYFQSVITWVGATFPNKRKKLMLGLPWGELYNSYKDQVLNQNELEQKIVNLIDDDEVESKKGIYQYLLTGQEKYLSLRAFTDKQKQKAYQKQKGICFSCKEHFDQEKMEGDHIIPWSRGGKTTDDNLHMLCMRCNRTKSSS